MLIKQTKMVEVLIPPQDKHRQNVSCPSGDDYRISFDTLDQLIPFNCHNAKQFLQIFYCMIDFIMSQMQSNQALQILEMSSLPKQQILRNLIKLFNQSTIQRFTLLIRQTPMKPGQSKQEFSLAVDQLGEAITTRPKSSTIDRYYRTSHFMNHQKSMTVNQSCIQSSLSDSEIPQSPKQLGAKLYRLGEYEQALSIFEQLKEQFPLENSEQQYRRQYKQVLNSLGNCYFRLNQYEKAVETYKGLIKQYSKQQADAKEEKVMAQCYNNLGCCYGKLGYQKLSMNSYKQALKIYNQYTDVDSSSLLYNIANTYFNCQMYEVSEKYYEQSIAQCLLKRPQDKNLLYHAYYKLSLAQTHSSKCREALENLGQAYKLAENGSGNVLDVLKQSAYVKEVEGKWQQALQFYEKIHILQQNKSKGFIFQSVAKIYLNIGKLAEHKKYINLALEEYEKDGNERKVSELSSNWAKTKPKK